MPQPIPDLLLSILVCPQCGAELLWSESHATCAGCRTKYRRVETGSLDLRLQRPKKQSVEFQLAGASIPDDFEFNRLEFSENPEVDFSGVQTPWHLAPELLSYFPRACSADSLALDLGCGTGLHRDVCQRAGFNWIGLDYGSPTAPILGDAHALPFANDSIDFVLSIAVLEHIQFPAVALKEVHRVLKRGGLFIGTVAFLEPFHGNSYYHHTHLGTFSSLSSAGFSVERVAPNPRWSGLVAQATMDALYPKMPHAVGRALVWPLETLHKLWWFVGGKFVVRADDTLRLITNTGSFEFVARKGTPDSASETDTAGAH